MVVRLDEGRERIRAYVAEHAARGLDHVLSLVAEENNLILQLIGDLTEEEGMTATPADEWSVYDVVKHLAASLDRSKDRLQKLSSGQPFVNPAGVTPGSMGSAEYASFQELRRSYIDGMADILAVLRRADAAAPTDLTADHGQYGPFNWLEWAIYSHHVHTHDHVDQLSSIRDALRGG